MITLIDDLNDVFLELPSDIAAYAPRGLGWAVHMLLVLVSGILFCVASCAAVVVGILSAPVWVPVVVYRMFKEW